MLDHALIAAPDYTQVRAALVRTLGGDAIAALVITRISWRLQRQPAGTWWRCNLEQIADETGLSADQVRRSIKKLREAGHLDARTDGTWDRTYHYRIVWSDPSESSQPAESQNASGDIAGSIRRNRRLDPAESPDVPSTKTTRQEQDRALPEYDLDSPEVLSMCGHLANQVEHTTGSRPLVTDEWCQDMLLLLTPTNADDIARAITWAHRDQFWRANVLTPAELARHLPRMRAQAGRDINGRSAVPDADTTARDLAAMPPLDPDVNAAGSAEVRRVLDQRHTGMLSSPQEISDGGEEEVERDRDGGP